MSTPLALPPQFGWIVLVCVASVVLLQYLGVNVGKARRKYNVPYPAMYCDTEHMFNCIQRAHQNTLEVYPTFLMLLIFGGVLYPILSALFGSLWIVSRVVYAHGYYTGDPAQRNFGAFGHIGMIFLTGATVSLALKLLRWI